SSSYGSSSKVEVQAGVTDSALITLGLAQGTVFAGSDVAGTINGEEANGLGQMLTGKTGNATTEGLRLKVELGEADISDGVEANIVVVKGIASKFDSLLESLTRSTEGLLASRSTAIKKQIDYVNDRIEDEEERLSIRRTALFKRFYEMEKLLNEFSTQGAFLETQLSQMSNYWKWNSN
ncbi:MAG: flagellar filament capping protein FliD, partial [candidate division Zixibacteria bacterium]|nr:flagellar filament capping protein FliD [candidate division Zixibacteria bacterium]